MLRSFKWGRCSSSVWKGCLGKLLGRSAFKHGMVQQHDPFRVTRLQGAQRNVFKGRRKTLSKLPQGRSTSNSMKEKPKPVQETIHGMTEWIFAVPNDQKCPVKAYKVYAEKRPAEMKSEDRMHCFTLAVNNVKSGNNDVLPTDIMQLSGHNVQSITSYSTVSQKQQLNMSHTLTGKFDSPFFSEQWNQMAARINTKFRGKRRTLIHNLQKTSLFWKQKDGIISLSFPTKKWWVG